eukprot:8877933-Pyramimonas_sp.AAC.1
MLIGTCVLDTRSSRTRLLRLSAADSTWTPIGTCTLDTRSNRTALDYSVYRRQILIRFLLESAYWIHGVTRRAPLRAKRRSQRALLARWGASWQRNSTG